MHPARVDRGRLRCLTDLPNVGPATAEDLIRLGITRPEQLIGKSPKKLYEKLCSVTGQRHDPCVIDVFTSIVRFMDGEAPRPWWDFSADRKRASRRA